MYRIFHRLFGWDYVFWKHEAGTCGISRIIKLPDGNYYIKRYYGSGFGDLNNKYDMQLLKLTYLTCDPSKYAK